LAQNTLILRNDSAPEAARDGGVPGLNRYAKLSRPKPRRLAQQICLAQGPLADADPNCRAYKPINLESSTKILAATIAAKSPAPNNVSDR